MMGEEEVVAELQAAHVLEAVQWAFRSAVTRALDDYVPDAGYDEQWLGETRYTLFRDRLDRVFSCRNYDVGLGDAQAGRDRLLAQLSPAEAAAMPRLAPGTVYRLDLQGSPGWVYGSCRLLLASAELGRFEQIAWTQKSPTKQAVARQLPSNADGQGVLFDLSNLTDPDDPQTALDMDTFVVVHALHPITGEHELAIGLPRLNDRGGAAWHWLRPLSPPAPDDSGWAGPHLEPTGPSTPVSDPVVKRRPQETGRSNGRAGDNR